MKAAVILAHPARDSLNAAIAAACVEAVEAQGWSADLRDLYAMEFDPRLQAEEIPGACAPIFGRSVLDERARLSDVDLFVFVYPLWFNAPPAILKGYVDRVFGAGFGFATGPEGGEPLLAGRRLLSFTTSGAPDHWVHDTHVLQDLQRLFDHHLCATCGMTLADHVHFGGMVTGVRPDVVDEVLMTVKQTVHRVVPRRQPATI